MQTIPDLSEPCERCGSVDVLDDVVDAAGALEGAAILQIAECLRCAFRWTRSLQPRALRVARRDGERPAQPKPLAAFAA